MSQTHEHLLIPFSPREAVISLFNAYFQLFEWTSDLRSTASALPTQFIVRSGSLTGLLENDLEKAFGVLTGIQVCETWAVFGNVVQH